VSQRRFEETLKMKYIITLGMLVAALAVLMAPASAQNGYIVVVNEGNSTASMTADEVSRIFMKRTAQWADGREVVPVDQSDGAAVRARFSQDVHGKSVSAIKSFWQRQIFSGRAVPPAERTSDAEVLAFVRANPAAIGYVRAGVTVAAGVKQLQISDR
jgi:ABC-type phosphate transport system substrate-binding protein